VSEQHLTFILAKWNSAMFDVFNS